MKISILGCGWYGLPLALELKGRGHEVKGSTRNHEKQRELNELGIETHLLDFPELPPRNLLDADVMVLNIPPFDQQLTWMNEWPFTDECKIIFISSTSVHNDSASGKILLAQENWLTNNYPQSVILRFGGLLGEKRHPGKVLSGRSQIASPNSPVNLLHLTDAIGVTLAMIEKNISGEVFDVVSDEHHTKKEFYEEYCLRNNILLPKFDERDQTTGKIISNHKIKGIYEFKVPTMLGKSL